MKGISSFYMVLIVAMAVYVCNAAHLFTVR